MAYKAFKPEYFKKMIQAAKKETVSYAFALGSGPGNHTFVLDTALGPKELWLKVKKEAGASKGSYGKCRVEGGALVLTPEKKIAGLKKHVKGKAKAAGWVQKDCKVLGPDGKEVGDDEDAPSPAPAPAPASDDQKSTASAPKGSDKLEAVWTKAVGLAEAELDTLAKALRDTGDDQAKAVAGKLKNALKGIPDVPGAVKALVEAGKKGEAVAIAQATAQVIETVKKAVDAVRKNDLLKELEDNPFSKISLIGTLEKALLGMQKALV